jgi:hypothetical protein
VPRDEKAAGSLSGYLTGMTLSESPLERRGGGAPSIQPSLQAIRRAGSCEKPSRRSGFATQKRIRDPRETLDVVRRARPTSDPTAAEDLAALHEVHAAPERKSGRGERAEAARRRPERARRTPYAT